MTSEKRISEISNAGVIQDVISSIHNFTIEGTVKSKSWFTGAASAVIKGKIAAGTVYEVFAPHGKEWNVELVKCLHVAGCWPKERKGKNGDGALYGAGTYKKGGNLELAENSFYAMYVSLVLACERHYQRINEDVKKVEREAKKAAIAAGAGLLAEKAAAEKAAAEKAAVTEESSAPEESIIRTEGFTVADTINLLETILNGEHFTAGDIEKAISSLKAIA